MNVLVHLPAARVKMGGGAIGMWRVAEDLRRRGLSVRFTAARIFSRMVRGVPVCRLAKTDIRWADVVLTGTGTTVHRVRGRPPLVRFVHSAVHRIRVAGADLIVWGSAALRARAQENGFESSAPDLVLWPPIDAGRVRVERPGDRVTLVNLLPEKGAHLFWQIVERMPDVQFLGVHGGWGQGQQIIPSPLPGNAEVMKFAADPRRVYERTRVLLYMRGQQTGPNWLNGVGMAAVEAAVSGIPTIAHPGPGLMESLGGAGTWVDSYDPAHWATAIRWMLESEAYAERSAAARERAKRFESGEGIDRLVTEMERLAA